MSSTRTEHFTPLEIGGRRQWIRAATFSTNGEYLLSGDEKTVRVWRMKDGREMATMEVESGVRCLAMPKNGRWIAAGTCSAKVLVWDAKTYERVAAFQSSVLVSLPLLILEPNRIIGLDFSPDSTRLVAAARNRAATVWEVETCRQVHTFDQDDLEIIAAKFSPQGDRIATATGRCVGVWGSDSGRLIVKIHARVTWYNCLVWSNNNIFVVFNNTIKEFDASTGSAVSEWTDFDSDAISCIALPTHGEFLACSTGRAVRVWDTSTHTQRAFIQHLHDISSIALSPDDQFITIIGNFGKTTVRSLSRITDLIQLSRLHPTFHQPDLLIDDATLDAWEHDQLTNAEGSLLARVPWSQNPSHHLLASRALVRARLQRWDWALVDAEEAIDLQPSVIGYIAKSIAHIGMGERDKGYHACDMAFERFHSSYGTFILLIRAIIVFMAGEHRDAISRVDDLITTDPLDPIHYVVQAYMYLLLGNSLMECRDYEGALQSFERARARMRPFRSRLLFVVTLISGWKFDDIDFMIKQRKCEALYATGCSNGTVECVHEMTNELEKEMNLPIFKQHPFERLEHLGDAAMNAQRYDEAIFHYTSALSFNPPSLRGILIKRSKTFVASGSWKEALDDANQVIRLDPSSPWGYEIKHAALHKAREYDSAIDTLEMMLSKIAQSSDPEVQQRGDQYISPSSTRATIRRIVQQTIRHSPRVLINTTTGCLRDRADQASAFEALPIFNELVSSMKTCTDYVRIKREVRQYFRYVMLSHRWEDNEPLFQQVIHTTVYDLEKSLTHDKLQTFCKIVRDAGFNWAWSDTCCINKSDHFVLQEALVAMFKWYQGSAMMIVFLRGVSSSSQRGALVKSVWNTRSWTLQEYIASKVIHFYTEDWTLYLDLELPNHKESPEVISEMEQATGVSAQQLIALRPGSSSIREKLQLASIRQTTLVEDAAYSLWGIFSAAGMPAIYGEGEAALGRLLAHVLTVSGDVSILAWTGESGSYSSCLPAHVTVFDGPATSHLPPPISDAEMERFLTASRPPSCDLDAALKLYDRLEELPAPWFAASRMRLPCIAFRLSPLSCYQTRSGRVYRADTAPFGTVEIKTRQDLSRMKSLYLVHPWFDTFLEREDKGHIIVEEDPDAIPPPSPGGDDDETFEQEINDEDISDRETEDDPSSLPEPESPLHTALPTDRETRAQRLVARLRQPFGALLFALKSTGRRRMDYKRVATDSVFTVQFQENFSLSDILDNVRTLDVL